MRSTTKTALGIISLGVLGVSYQLGNAATVSTGGFASPTTPLAVSTPDAAASSTPDPATSASASAAPTASATKSTTTSKKATSTSSAPAASASSAPSAAASAPASTGASVSKTGDSVESGFGTVQVKVTKTDGKITDITMVQANATHGRAAAFPYLVQYAITANGANFANLSGATYTTNAFKESLRTALAKF